MTETTIDTTTETSRIPTGIEMTNSTIFGATKEIHYQSSYQVPSQQLEETDEQMWNEIASTNPNDQNNLWHEFLHMYGTVTKMAKPKREQGRAILRQSSSSMRTQLSALYKPQISEDFTTSLPVLITNKRTHNRKHPACSPEKTKNNKKRC